MITRSETLDILRAIMPTFISDVSIEIYNKFYIQFEELIKQQNERIDTLERMVARDYIKEAQNDA